MNLNRKGVSNMRTAIARFVMDESGATAIEYGLSVAGIAAAVVAAMVTLGPAIQGLLESVVTEIS
jgi:pilus assembly protein Flp/PilA